MKKYNKNIPFYIGILIILHHYKKHKNDKDLSTLEKFVQITDIDNHETWALFFLGIGIGMRLKSNNQLDNQLHTLLDNPVVDQLIDQMVNIMNNQMVNIKTIISTDKAPAAIGPYSQATTAGNMAFISGCIGLIPGTKDFAEGGIEGQTRQVLENLKAVVEASGSKLENVVKTTVLLDKDMSSYATVNQIYAEFFPSNPPARAEFAVAALPAGALIEIDAIAIIE